ncbi:MAG: hypothetical protein ABWX74_19320 [Aeromicrobium sp.]
MTTQTLPMRAPRRRLALKLGVAGIAASLGMTMAAALPAQAAEPRDDTGDGSVSITSALTTRAGSTVLFEGAGFAAGTTGGAPSYQVVSVKIDDVGDVVKTVQLQPDGTFEGSVTLPTTLPTGEHWLRFLGSNPVVSKHTQKFTTVDTLPAGADFSVTVAGGSRGVDPTQITTTLAGQGFVGGETLTAKVDGVAKDWTSGSTTSPTLTVTGDGTFSAARLVFAPGTLRAGKHTLVITRSAPNTDPIAKEITVNPAAAFSSLSSNSIGTLTLTNLTPGTTISKIVLGDVQFTTPVTANDAGAATISYTIPATATLGTQAVTITQSAPTATTYTLSAKVSPSAAPFGTENFARVETPKGTIQQGLYQSAYSAASDAVFATTANVTSTSTLYKLDPTTLAVKASVVPAVQTGTALWAAYGVGVDDRNGTVWVTNTRQNTIAVYRQSDLTLVKQFPAGTIQHSRDVLADTTRNKVFVTSAAEGTSGEGYIDVYDGTTLLLLERIETGARTSFSPMSLDLDEADGVLYTVSNSSAKALAIDVKGTDYATRVIDLDLPTGAKPSGVAVDDAANKLFVANQGTDNLLILDATTGALVKNVATGAGALNVTFDQVHQLAYVSNFGGTTISVVSEAGDVIANLPFARANHVEADGKGSVFAVNKDADNQVIKLTPNPITGAVPTIQGTAKTGQVLTASPGAWSTGVALSYQWSRSGAPIAGATGQTYRLVAGDVAQTITVTVTGSRAGFASVSQTSAGTKVAKGTLASAKPKVTGKAKVGKTIKVSRGSWTSGTTFTYSWYANGKAIKGAKKSSLKLTSAQKGKRITVKVTGSKSGYASVSKTSGKTSKVAKK